VAILLHGLDDTVLQRWSEALAGAGAPAFSKSLSTLSERLLAGVVAVAYVDLVNLPGGGETLQRLARRFPAVRLVAMTAVPEPTEGLALIGAGMRGYCNRLIAPKLLAVVHGIVEAGEVWAGGAVLQHLLDRHLQHDPGPNPPADDPVFPDLTEREREISDLVADGLSNKVIAARLGISERTVKAHLNAVFRKTGLSSRTQLALALQAAPVGDFRSTRLG
jgi:DNA-binding NarL/FixJ family response regulator